MIICAVVDSAAVKRNATYYQEKNKAVPPRRLCSIRTQTNVSPNTDVCLINTIFTSLSVSACVHTFVCRLLVHWLAFSITRPANREGEWGQLSWTQGDRGPKFGRVFQIILSLAQSHVPIPSRVLTESFSWGMVILTAYNYFVQQDTMFNSKNWMIFFSFNFFQLHLNNQN